MKAAIKKAPRKKAANGYKLPDPIPKGEILEDLKKQQWIINTSIGVGGFGEIYAAAQYNGKTPSDYPAVIKIEPHENGPLFVERNFYMRNANPTDISSWIKEKKLQNLGMPPFLGSGSHDYNGQKYRFLVMERYGIDLWKLFLENARKFPEHTVYKVAWQIINVLEYIHSRTYVHADIKGANLLLDLKDKNNVYVVDFGLASKYTTKNEFKLDPKNAHNGTIEYTSRDAHMGVPTMRGDMEILLYNMIQWLCGSLPWETNLKDPAFVQQQKEKAFNNVQKFLKECFTTTEIPACINQFMSLLASMKYNEIPNYNKFRDILVKGLQKINHTLSDKLEFSNKELGKVSTPKRKKTTEAKDSAKKAKTSVTKSSKAKRNKASLNDSLNSSIDTIVLDEKCMTGNDIRKQLLSNIEGDAEYEVQIKKRKAKVNAINSITPTKATTMRGRKKIVQQIETSITDSEPEIIARGTKSRPAAKTSKNSKQIETTKRLSNRSEYDSEKDMFDD